MRSFYVRGFDRTFTGFDHTFDPNCEWIAQVLIVGDLPTLYLDGPEAASEVHEYLQTFEDGARLLGVFRRLPGTQAPVADADKWTPATGGQL